MVRRNKFWILACGLIIGASVTFSSCGDEEEATQIDDGKVMSKQYNISQSEVDQVATYADDALKIAGKGGRMMAKTYCAAYSHDKEAKTIVLDFGTAGCTGSDGKVRKGKITVVYIGTLELTGTNARTVSFADYSVDGNVVNGSLSSTKYTLNGTAFSSTLTATGITFKFAEDNTTLSLAGSWVRTLTVDAADFTNSSYSITGSSTGTTREGKAFTSTITSALTYKLSCLKSQIPYPTLGKQEIVVAGTIPFTTKIDYGSGECDKKITVTVGKTSTEYTLP